MGRKLNLQEMCSALMMTYLIQNAKGFAPLIEAYWARIEAEYDSRRPVQLALWDE